MRGSHKFITVVVGTLSSLGYFHVFGKLKPLKQDEVKINAVGGNYKTNNIACPINYTLFSDTMANLTAKSTDQLIPKVLYQTSKSRCMHPDLASAMNVWRDPVKFPGFSYFFYDDDAMDTFLFDKERWQDTFPSLHLALQCVNKLHNPTIKADIWRYLVLWEYGGIYADIDVAPTNFTGLSIQPDDDGLFHTEGVGVWLAQFFLIASPRHPLMYYAVHAAVQNLLDQAEFSDNNGVNVAKVTGPGALADAMSGFMNNATAGRHISNGNHIGMNNRSIRVFGPSNRQVTADATGWAPKKKRIYKAMNMTHFHHIEKGERLGSCYNMMNATKTQIGFEYEGDTVSFTKFPR